jgi:hypothetical protein
LWTNQMPPDKEKGHMGTALAKHSLLPRGLRDERLNIAGSAPGRSPGWRRRRCR